MDFIKKYFIYLFIFFITIFTNCTPNCAMKIQYISLSPLQKKVFNSAGIILTDRDYIPVRTSLYYNICVPDILISKKLVPDYLDRFYIAHYIRNRINYLWFIYGITERKGSFYKHSLPYFFHEYETYVIENAELICNVIYHFIISCYNEVFHELEYNNNPGLTYTLVNDELLGEHLDLLIEKLRAENKFFMDN